MAAMDFDSEGEIDVAVIEAIRDKRLFAVKPIATFIGVPVAMAYTSLQRLKVAGKVTEDAGMFHIAEAAESDFLKLTQEQAKDAIIGAIDALFRTRRGIKKYLKVPDSVDIDEILVEMQNEYRIRKHDLGSVDVFFRYDQLPTKMQMIGGGQVEAEFDPDYRPRDEAAKLAELNTGAGYAAGKPAADRTVKQREVTPDVLEYLAANKGTFAEIAAALELAPDVVNDRISNDPDLLTAFNRGKANNTINPQLSRHATASPTNGAVPSRIHRRDLEEIDLGDVLDEEEDEDDMAESHGLGVAAGMESRAGLIERHAAENPDKKAIAKALGMSEEDLEVAFKATPDLKDAWKRGRAMHQSKNRTDSVDDAARKPVGRGKPNNFTAGELKAAAAKHYHLGDTARPLGYTANNPLKRKLERDPEMQKAFDEGQALYVEENGEPVRKRGTRTPKAPPQVTAKPKRKYSRREKPAPAASEKKTKAVAPVAASSRVAVEEPHRSNIQMEIDGNDAPISGKYIRIPLSGSGAIYVAIDAEMFSTTREDREIIGEIIEAVQSIGQKRIAA